MSKIRFKSRGGTARKKIIISALIIALAAGVIIGGVLSIRSTPSGPGAPDVPADDNPVITPDDNPVIAPTNENAGKQTLAVIDGEIITEAEFTFNLYSQVMIFEQAGTAGDVDIWAMDFDGQSAESLAKQKTLENIRLLKVCAKRAKEEGIHPTQRKLNEAKAFAEQNIGFMPDIMIERYGLNSEVIELCNIDAAYYQALFEHYTNNIEITYPEDYEAELAGRISREREYWTNNAREEGTLGMDEEFTEEEIKQIVDDVTKEYNDSIEYPQKLEYYEQFFNSWVENIDIEINHEVYDAITVDSLFFE